LSCGAKPQMKKDEEDNQRQHDNHQPLLRMSSPTSFLIVRKRKRIADRRFALLSRRTDMEYNHAVGCVRCEWWVGVGWL
jgi:hypothetical protein